jgi:ubiquinone/menaquinone biosynthesis C-methylase UbiE
MSPESKSSAEIAAKPYSTPFLSVYDLWVVRLSNSYGWRCDAKEMLALYNANLSAKHLEVGPGSGWYLANGVFPVARPSVTLLDLNPNSLEFSRKRLGAADVATVVGSVLEPVPAEAGDGFGSIGINYVLHCVPGTFAEKGVAFTHLARVLADDGVLFGSTVLGRDRPAKNLFGRALMSVYNRVGAFNNREDDRAGLEAALQAAFSDVELFDIGDVTLFTARGPRRG